jgi:hypothetical protein
VRAVDTLRWAAQKVLSPKDELRRNCALHAVPAVDTLRWAAQKVLSPSDELHLVTVLDTAHTQQVNTAETAPIPDPSAKVVSAPATP